MDVLVLLPYPLAGTLRSERLGCVLQNHPEIPSLLINIRKRGAGQPGLSIDMSQAAILTPISYQTAAFTKQNNSFNEQSRLFLACLGAVAILLMVLEQGWIQTEISDLWNCSVAFACAPETFYTARLS